MSKNEKVKLSQENKMLNQTVMRSWMLFGSFNMVKMQGTGYAQIMQPAIDKFMLKMKRKGKKR